MISVCKMNEHLLEAARAVFGEDLIVGAYVTTWEVEGVSQEEDVLKRLDAEGSSWGAHYDRCLGFDGTAIHLCFANGRRLEFSSSEWGSVSEAAEYRDI